MNPARSPDRPDAASMLSPTTHHPGDGRDTNEVEKACQGLGKAIGEGGLSFLRSPEELGKPGALGQKPSSTVSSHSVTGPSFSMLTSMSAPNRPDATCATPASRRS